MNANTATTSSSARARSSHPTEAICGAVGRRLARQTAGTVPLSLRTPVAAIVVARAGRSRRCRHFATAWSPARRRRRRRPVRRAVADGPRVRAGLVARIRLQLREATARGRVTIGLRRGTKGSFRSVGHATLGRKPSWASASASIAPGRAYAVRFVYRGSPTSRRRRGSRRASISRQSVACCAGRWERRDGGRGRTNASRPVAPPGPSGDRMEVIARTARLHMVAARGRSPTAVRS